MESSRFIVLACPVLCLPGGAGRGGAGCLLPPPVARFAGLTSAGPAGARPLRLTVARPPAAAANPGPWVAWDDDTTKVDVYKVIYWSATEALELMRETPPPPLGVHDYLHAFGLSFGAMPASYMDRDLIAAILYVSKATRECVRKHRERLRKLQMRKHWEARDKERKEAADEDAASLEEEQEASGDYPELGAGGV